MGRMPQPRAERGSQKWIQRLVNEQPEVLDSAIGLGPVRWFSPLAVDDFAEYRDAAVVELLGIRLARRALEDFWPTGGPQWDALGRTESGRVVLAEAKAHVPELFTQPSQASPDSLSRIRAALHETAAALRATPGADWSALFYQYANRLAHAYLFHEVNGVPTKLVFVYFIGDTEMNGPRTRGEWEAAIAVLLEAMGLRGRVPEYVSDVFIEVGTSFRVVG